MYDGGNTNVLIMWKHNRNHYFSDFLSFYYAVDFQLVNWYTASEDMKQKYWWTNLGCVLTRLIIIVCNGVQETVHEVLLVGKVGHLKWLI